ncbi:MAG: TonB family protein [Saccharospirillaceae bacterium]|nr:TonB family protein [Saccharospirillaceae bacterium]MCD8530454.1 TonB family protein [Saccharospirillaceae bacterium]
MRFLLFFLTFWLVPAQALELQAMGTYRRLNNDIYLAAVYSDLSDSQQWLTAEQPLALEIRVLAERISPRRFYRLWNEGLAINLSEAEMNARLEDISRFSNLLKEDLLEGDRVLITNESGPCRVEINDVEVLVIDDGSFVRLLLTAWIGKFPQSPGFREDLLRMNPAARQALETRWEAQQVKPGRTSAIAGWQKRDAGHTPELQTVTVVAEEQAIKTVAVAQNVVSDVPKLSQPAPALPPVPRQAAAVTVAAAEEVQVEKALPEVTDKVVEVPQQLRDKEAQEQAQEKAQMIARQQAEMQYYRALLRQANNQVEYPDQALRKRLEGTVRVSVLLNREGELLVADTSESSTLSLLDRAALRAAKKAAPYPPVPPLMEGENFEFDIPFRFVLARN